MARRLRDQTTIGERIMDRRLLRGWSVRYAAGQAGMSQASWSRIEHGLLPVDNQFVLAEIAYALAVTPVELTGTPLPIADPQALAAQTGVHAIREALLDIDVPVAGRASRALPALRRELATVRDLRHSCDYAGAARLLPALLRDLHASAAGPARGPVLRLLCDATFLASSLLRCLGRPAEASLAARLCRHVAETTEDRVLLGYADYARASVALSAGSFARGLALSERAVDDLEPYVGGTDGLEVLGTLQLVCGYAARGLRRADDSETWTSSATGIAERTGETTSLGLFFGPTNVNVWRIGIENDGGEWGRAVELVRATNPAVLGVQMRDVFFHVDAARAYARIRGGDRDAIRHLLTAERTAPQHVHSSPLVQETARALLERARRQAGGAALRGLCGRLGLADAA